MIDTVAVDSEHHDELAVFLAQFQEGGETPQFWMDQFRHWWDDNPVAGDNQRGWVLTDDGAIVGFLGMIASEFQVLGTTTTAYGATTWRVAEAYRSHSLGLLLRAIQASKNTVLFITSPTFGVMSILEKLDFELVPRGDGDGEERRAAVLLVRPSAAIARRLGGGLLGATLGVVLGPAAQVIQAARIGRVRSRGLDIRRVEFADESFDDLWSRSRDRWPSTNVRSASALNWYCFDGLGDKLLVGAWRGETLVGFAIFWARGGRPELLECVDLWVDPAEGGALDELVMGSREVARDYGADAVLFSHFNAELRARLKSLGLFNVTLGQRSDYFRASMGDGAFDPDLMYLGETQGDATFFS